MARGRKRESTGTSSPAPASMSTAGSRSSTQFSRLTSGSTAPIHRPLARDHAAPCGVLSRGWAVSPPPPCVLAWLGPRAPGIRQWRRLTHMAVAPPRTRKSARRQRLEAAVNYPLDWLEERSGLVGGIRYFLFRKVPGDTNWFHTLGSATLTAFLVQALTGAILAMYYKPDPNSAYQSINQITNHVTLGWLVRGMHKWGASVFIILLFFHMARVFLFGAYKYPRELNWIVGVLLLVLGMLEGFAGYLLPWDQTAYWATVVGINLNGTGPIVGPLLAQFLRGGDEIGADTLTRFYALHMLLLPGALFALIGLPLYLVVRPGVSSPPWSDEAAGAHRPEPEPTGQRGLIRPAPRGGRPRGEWFARRAARVAPTLQGGRRGPR